MKAVLPSQQELCATAGIKTQEVEPVRSPSNDGHAFGDSTAVILRPPSIEGVFSTLLTSSNC